MRAAIGSFGCKTGIIINTVCIGDFPLAELVNTETVVLKNNYTATTTTPYLIDGSHTVVAENNTHKKLIRLSRLYISVMRGIYEK